MNAIRPRITARVDTDTQSLLTQAAALAGISSINSFVLRDCKIITWPFSVFVLICRNGNRRSN